MIAFEVQAMIDELAYPDDDCRTEVCVKAIELAEALDAGVTGPPQAWSILSLRGALTMTVEYLLEDPNMPEGTLMELRGRRVSRLADRLLEWTRMTETERTNQHDEH